MVVFDIFSHGLWGGALFGWRKYYWAAFSFGIMPDALSFGPFLLYRFLAGFPITGSSPPEIIPAWVYSIYNITHSLTIAGLIVFVFLFKINKAFGFASLAWPLHILMDIPAHTKDYFPTPFLYPLSNFTVDGTDSIYLAGVNWALLIGVCVYLNLKGKNGGQA